MNKNTLLVLLISLTLGLLQADPPDWDLNGSCVLNNYNDYENNGSITARVYSDSLEGGDIGDLIATFVDNEQRGVGCADEVPVFLGGGIAFLMMIYSDQTDGETLTFQYYDESQDNVYVCNETLDDILMYVDVC